MAININNLSNSNQVKQQSQVKQQATQSSVTAEQAKTASKDSVSITPQAKQLGELQKKAKEGPAIDQKKIEELKKAIVSGEYKVDPKKLATAKTLKDSLNLALNYNIVNGILGITEYNNYNDVDINVDQTVVMISVSDKLLFNTGSYQVKKSAITLITKLADIIQSEPSMDVMIEGHTDSRTISNESVQDNWDLSVKRATSIVRLLQDKFNIEGSRLIASGRGDTMPLFPNTTKENRAKNRRTRIVILPNLNKFFALLTEEGVIELEKE